MSELNDFFKLMAEGKKTDPKAIQAKEIKENIKSDLGDLFSQMAEMKKQDPLYQKNKKLEEQIHESVQADIGSLFAELASLKNQKQEMIAGNPELVDKPIEESVEEIAEEILIEVAPLNTPIGNIPVDQQLEPENNPVVGMDSINKYLGASETPKEQPKSTNTSQYDIDLINKKIKFIEQWVGKIQNAGPGGGEVNFRYLDDVDRSTIGENKYLTYDATTKKFKFVTISGGGAPQVQSDWDQTDNTEVDYIKNKPELFSGDYDDLTNKPTIPEAQVNSDWNSTSGVSQILNKPTIPDTLNSLTDVVITNPLNNQVLKYDAVDHVWVNASDDTTSSGGNTGYYLSAYDTTDQSCTHVNTATPVRFNNTTFGANGILIGANTSHIIIANAGVYNVQFSFQFHNQGGGGNGQTVQIWLAQNGVDIPDTNTRVDVISNSPYIVAAWNFVLPVDAGDYLQLMWSTDNTNIVIDANSSVAPGPHIPSAIVTVTPVANIIAAEDISGNAGTADRLHNARTINGVSFDGSADITITADYTTLTNKPTLFSGAYADLTGKPTLFSGSYTDLTSKPTLFSGSYTDLTDKPSIPSLTGYATETYVSTAITNLIGAAPSALDTLKEIADQLAADESAVSSLTTAVSGKVSLTGTYANPDWITSLAYSKLTGAPSLATVATSGSYADLTNKPTIPTTTSQLTNNSGYVANTSGAYIELINLGIATMRADDHVMLQAAGYGWSFRLDGKLEFPDNTMQTTAWTGSVAYSSVTGKPTFATVATSGSYTDLTSKPTIYSSAYIGTTSLDFTRASGAQTLNGVSISGNAGTVTNGVYTTDTGTVTNTMLAGNIANAKLLNSSATIGTSLVALGATVANLEGLNLVSATYLSGTLTGAAPAGSLSGTTLKSTVVNSSLTSVGTLAGLRTTGHNNFGSDTYTKAGYGTGDISLDNGSTDTPALLMYYANNNNFGVDSYNGTFSILSGQLFRITNNLNESGGAVKLAIDTTGNMVTTGFIQPSAWRAGQIIRDTMLSNSDFTVNATTVATSTSDTDFITYSYTPTSSSSYLIIHVHVADYRAASDTGGAGTDSYFARIKVDGGEIVYARQMTRSNESGRTGSLFPLTGRYTNSNTTAKTITVGVRRDSADDNITLVNSSTALSMRITEIAR